MSGKKTHIRYFVEPRTGDGLNTQPHPVALEEVGAHIKNWLARFEHQGYYSGVGCRIMLGEIAFRLEPVVCGEDGEPWEWTHCAVCDKELDSHGDCVDNECKTHTDPSYTGEPSGSSVAGVRVVSPEELVAILRRDEAANRAEAERSIEPRGFVDKLSAEEKAFIAERESDNAKMDEAREYSAEDVEEWQRRSEEQGE